MKYEASNGVVIRLTYVYSVRQSIVFTGRIEKLPNDQEEILTDKFNTIMKEETLLGRKIIGTEWFATSYQRIGSNVGLCVKMEEK